VLADAHHLRRQDRGQQPNVVQLRPLTGRLDVAEQGVSTEPGDEFLSTVHVRVDHAEADVVAHSEPCDTHLLPPQLLFCVCRVSVHGLLVRNGRARPCAPNKTQHGISVWDTPFLGLGPISGMLVSVTPMPGGRLPCPASAHDAADVAGTPWDLLWGCV